MLSFYARPTTPFKLECEDQNTKQNIASQIDTIVQSLQSSDEASRNISWIPLILVCMFTRIAGPFVIPMPLMVCWMNRDGWKGGILGSGYLTSFLGLYSGILAYLFIQKLQEYQTHSGTKNEALGGFVTIANQLQNCSDDMTNNIGNLNNVVDEQYQDESSSFTTRLWVIIISLVIETLEQIGVLCYAGFKQR